MHPLSIKKLIDLFSKFPTVGPRTASRFVFYLIKLPQDKFDEILKSMTDLKKTIKICPLCFNPFDPATNLGQEICHICANKSRDKNLLCVVEKEIDLSAIEKTKKYKGLYFILGGTIGFKKKNRNKIRTEELKERIKSGNFKEIIIAVNPTPEGEATTLLVEREIRPLGIPCTRLGRGLPTGGELEYADQDTLSDALERRK